MAMTNPLHSRRVPRFVEEYCKDENGTRAALRAGWPESWAHVAACRLLKEPNVQALIEEQKAKIAQECLVEAADILRDWLDIATADASKLGRVRRVNCRHCWGNGHQFQWKAREYAEACDNELKAAQREKREAELPDCSGGFDFNRIAEPNPSCPECEGEGVEEVFVADIETLTGPERKLFAGIRMTKYGPEVVLRDQDKARDNIAKYLGLLVERKELTGKDGRPLIPEAPPVDLPNDPQQLAALYSQIVGG